MTLQTNCTTVIPVKSPLSPAPGHTLTRVTYRVAAHHVRRPTRPRVEKPEQAISSRPRWTNMAAALREGHPSTTRAWRTTAPPPLSLSSLTLALWLQLRLQNSVIVHEGTGPQDVTSSLSLKADSGWW